VLTQLALPVLQRLGGREPRPGNSCDDDFKKKTKSLSIVLTSTQHNFLFPSLRRKERGAHGRTPAREPPRWAGDIGSSGLQREAQAVHGR
jgi:hypothetical protein